MNGRGGVKREREGVEEKERAREVHRNHLSTPWQTIHLCEEVMIYPSPRGRAMIKGWAHMPGDRVSERGRGGVLG
jgi:hypothetical protein